MFSNVQLDYLLEENVLNQEKGKKILPNNLSKTVSWQINPYHLARAHSTVIILVKLKLLSTTHCINNPKYCEPLCTWSSP